MHEHTNPYISICIFHLPISRRADGSAGDEIKNANVFIANLPKTVDEEQLKSMFAPYGEIIRSKILVDHQTGVSKGCGFILFSKTSEADWAISGKQSHFESH